MSNTSYVKVGYKEQYPYINDTGVNLTGIGYRERGRIIYLSSRLIQKYEVNNSMIDVLPIERLNEFVGLIKDAVMVKTEKGTYIMKYQEGAKLYIIEIPSGFRGGVATEILKGNCLESVILQSGSGRLGIVDHLWCNGDSEIKYSISGRTRTSGYGYLTDIFGESLEGIVRIQNESVRLVSEDVERELKEGEE